MAAPIPSTKVNDKEYTNWLKVTLALYYMKSGLHTFIQSEVDCLHQSLIHKIYRGQTVPLPPCTMCHASRVKRNKFTGVWTFQKRCRSYCDVWLDELLVLHTSPKSDKIYWNNSDVPSWPFKPWECAKVFMPKGQQPTNAGPSECDAQALLTLLASCTHFHQKLSPQGLGLTHTISTIRNNIIHNGEMKVSDVDRMSFIHQIIQLLEDPVSLVSLEDCKAAVVNIHKEERTTSDKTMRLIQWIQQGSQDTYEKFKECLVQAKQENLKEMLEEEEANFAIDQGKGTLTKRRRQQSDGLKQLKRQTENRLDTFKKLECIHTTQTKDAKKRFELKRSIVIRGNPGEGKTTMALHLIDNEIYRDRRVVLYSPRAWKAVDTEWVDIVMLEDVFGQFDLDPGRLQEWMVYLPTIQEHVDVGKLQVIITTRVDILSKAYSTLASLKLFSDDLTLTLSSENLTNSEKMNILNRELRRHKREMKENEKEKCITNFSGLIGFPQCCSLFAVDNNLFDRGPDFFSSPKKFFIQNITGLEPARFLPLAFLFCNGQICEEYLSPDTMPESSKHLFMELSSRLSKEKADITLLRDAYYRFLELYVVKCKSHDFSLGHAVEKPSIQFTHATVSEAVGQVLGDRCPEMVVKYGDSEYLYQRTYTAETKDSTSENVFLPVYVYGLLAERMVFDVVEKELARSAVKHSALKQVEFIKTLKGELHKSNRIMKFLMANPYPYQTARSVTFYGMLAEGECVTFLQYILQSDEDEVRLVYNEFLELLECAHNTNKPGCLKCEEKQKLSELALYYNHFEIADKLIIMNASYTHVSLCNAARHGDLSRVQTILKTLKGSQDFNPKCFEAKEALYRAYISGNQSLIDVLLKEEITLDSKHVVDVVRHGDVNNLKKVVEHLKCHDNWIPLLEQYEAHQDLFHLVLHWDSLPEICYVPFTKALCIAYCNEKFDMADYLVKNQVKVSMYILVSVSEYGSQKAVDRMIQNMKLTGIWDPHCHYASKALEKALCVQKYDVCKLLIQEGVLLTMKNLYGVVYGFHVPLKSVKKAIKHLKNTDNWDPKSVDAAKALENAFIQKNYHTCDLLLQEGVQLTMKNLPGIVIDGQSLKSVMKAMQNLKDTCNWDPKSDDAAKALEKAFIQEINDLCDLLLQEGVQLTMKNLPGIVIDGMSFESVEKAKQHLKITDNWDPKSVDAAKALENAFIQKNYHTCDLLLQEGVQLTMKNLPGIVIDGQSLKSVMKAMQHLKDTCNWDPKSDDAAKALENAFIQEINDLCDLLLQEGVQLTMKNLPGIVIDGLSLESVEKAKQHLKITDNWDPKSVDAAKTLENAFIQKNYHTCDLLLQEGFQLTMKNLPGIVIDGQSLKSVMKAMQHLKDTCNWDPKSDDAAKALENAFIQEINDLCDLFLEEGVQLTMKNLPNIVIDGQTLKSVMKAMQYLKDTCNWDPKSDDAASALENAFIQKNYHTCDLLLQEGVQLTMKTLPYIVIDGMSFESIEKAIKHLKITCNWDPKSVDAAKALENAFIQKNYHTCDLLLQEGVQLTMKTLPYIVIDGMSFESIEKAIKHLKITDNWDPKSDDAASALENAFIQKNYHTCDLLLQEGVQLTMKNLPGIVIDGMSFESVKKAKQHLKITDNWDPKSVDAAKALENAFIQKNYHTCDLLLQEGVQLTMKNLPGIVIDGQSLKSVMKAMQHLKDTCNWDPKSDDAAKALENAFIQEINDLCDLFLEEGVQLTMKNLPGIVIDGQTLKSVMKAMQYLKDTCNWDPKSDDAAKALENAFVQKNYHTCDLLLQEGVQLTMKNLPGIVIDGQSLKSVMKAMQHLKDTCNWDPKSDDAAKALENAFIQEINDLCDLLLQEGVQLTMKNLPGIVIDGLSLESVEKAKQHLKITDNWDPKSVDAAKALENAFIQKNYHTCDLLLQEGVQLTMKTLPYIVIDGMSFESIEKAIKHLKITDNWDPKSVDAAKALENAFIQKNYHTCDLLLQEGVQLTMKNLPGIVIEGMSFESIEKAIKHLKITDNWDPKSVDAASALENAFIQKNYHTCDLLLQEGVQLTMKNLPGIVIDGMSFESVKKAKQHLKITDNWDPKSVDAAKALENAFIQKNYHTCDLLLQEGVQLTMKNLPGIVIDGQSLKSVMKAMQHLKDTCNWDPKSDDAAKALEKAFIQEINDLCDLFLEEGVQLTMKNLPGIVIDGQSLKSVMKAMQYLKDTWNWDPKSVDAAKALENAFIQKNYHTCDLLLQEGVQLTMKNLSGIVIDGQSLKSVMKAMQHLKDTCNWDPKSDDAAKALEKAFIQDINDFCDLLLQEGAQLTMKNLPGIVIDGLSLESVEKAKQHFKITDNWDPKSVDAAKALENAFIQKNYHTCDLLLQEGVQLTMKNLPGIVNDGQSLKSVMKAMQHLKDTCNWDPKSDDAAKALENAFIQEINDLCDLFLEEGVQLTMKNLPGIVIDGQSLKSVMKAMQYLKDTCNWDPKSDDAAKALENAFIQKNYHTCDLLLQEGVQLTMKNLPGIVIDGQSLKSVMKAMQHLKDTCNWDPKSDYAAKALENAFIQKNYHTCDLLLQEGVQLTMKNFPGIVIDGQSLKSVMKAIQHLMDMDEWDPSSDYAKDSLAETKSLGETNIYILLISEGVCDLELEKQVKDQKGGFQNQESQEIDKTSIGDEFEYAKYTSSVAEVADSLRAIEKKAKIRVWLGTDLAKQKTVFVCLYEGVIEKTLKTYKGIDIYYKDSQTPSRPLEPRHKIPIKSEVSFCFEDAKLLQQAIDKHGLDLFKKHSNLEAITGSSFMLSKRNGYIERPSVVLYCQVKGIAPMGEVAFPSTLTTSVESLKVHVDVREGYFRQGMFQQSQYGRWDRHDKLRMGISIGVEHGGKGTLGPFVKINNEKVGFLTCAHVIVSDPRVQSALDRSVGERVLQPADGESFVQESRDDRYCGEVSKIVFNPNLNDPTNGLVKCVGVDAALVTVNGIRHEDVRSFPFIADIDLKNAGFDPANPPKFGQGSIKEYPLKFEDVQGVRVIKYGRTTALTKGTLFLDGTMVKVHDANIELSTCKENVIMMGQYVVERQGRNRFFDGGDSGSGVFMVDKDNKLTCIGLGIGYLDEWETVVTPIEYVLKALGLTVDAMKL